MEAERNTGPLKGVRIVDLTWAAAGPFGTQYLGFLGADLIKIESRRRLENRRTNPVDTGQIRDSINRGVIFNNMNMNKMSLTLDLGHPEAGDLVKRLVNISDVVIDNFRPGVMARFGLDYCALRSANPSVIVLSSSNSGQAGPESHYMGYAPIFAALGGLGHMTGFEDGPPTEFRIAGDLRNGLVLAMAITIALYHRKMTGQGQFIDLASRDVQTMYIGEALMEYAMNGRVPSRSGNQDPSMSPCGCYPCEGDDAWLSIAVGSEEEWHALCGAIGQPGLAVDARFADMYLRIRNRKALDEVISTWTRQHAAREAMELLQKAWVAAAPSFSSRDLLHDPHLRQRNTFVQVHHPEVGITEKQAPPWRFSRTLAAIRRHAPLLAEHNEYVLRELLGLGGEAALQTEQGGVLF